MPPDITIGHGDQPEPHHFIRYDAHTDFYYLGEPGIAGKTFEATLTQIADETKVDLEQLTERLKRGESVTLNL